MTTRIFKDHTCKNVECNNLAEKDRFGLYRAYCSDECNPRKKPKICEYSICTNLKPKDKYGNYMTYCSDECMKLGRAEKFKTTYESKDTDAILVKRKATVQLRYGADNVSKTADVKAQLKITTKATAGVRLTKTKATNLKNHGVESTNSLQSVKDTKKATFQRKYGVDHQLQIPTVAASVSTKNSDNADERLAEAKITKELLYGDENYNNRTKYKETCLTKFGVENPSQNAEVHEKKVKNSYKSKDYKLPSGLIVQVQGWENKALDKLFKEYTEDEIQLGTANIPRITYFDELGKQHYYFPDIYIPKDNLIIEVKSQWTYDKNIPRHMLKKDACIAQGYNFKFIIMTK